MSRVDDLNDIELDTSYDSEPVYETATTTVATTPTVSLAELIQRLTPEISSETFGDFLNRTGRMPRLDQLRKQLDGLMLPATGQLSDAHKAGLLGRLASLGAACPDMRLLAPALDRFSTATLPADTLAAWDNLRSTVHREHGRAITANALGHATASLQAVGYSHIKEQSYGSNTDVVGMDSVGRTLRVMVCLKNDQVDISARTDGYREGACAPVMNAFLAEMSKRGITARRRSTQTHGECATVDPVVDAPIDETATSVNGTQQVKL